MLTLAWGGIAQAAETTTYVLTDDQGTVLMLTDNHGNPVARFDNRPYGEHSGPVNAGPGYTGHVNDSDTGLVYMQARYYDPETGRFFSADPIPPMAGDTFMLNRYAYVNNNPTIHVDPTGMACGGNGEVSPTIQRMRDFVDGCQSGSGDRRGRGPRDHGSPEKKNDSDHVAEAVSDRLAKMAAKKLIKKYSPGAVKPWIGVLSRSIAAAKRAENWGEVAASINDITLSSGLKDIQFYKDAGIVPPTGRIYYFSAVPWGQLDWAPYDNGTLTLPSEQVWDNFVHDRQAGEW